MLSGISIGGYRSFDSVQRLDLRNRITLLAGRNNVGKSNVVHFLKDVFPVAMQSIKSYREHQWDSVELHFGNFTGLTAGVGFEINSFSDVLAAAQQGGPPTQSALQSFLDALSRDGLVWFESEWTPTQQQFKPLPSQAEHLEQAVGAQELRVLAFHFAGGSAGSRQDALSLIARLHPILHGWNAPKIEVVPAFRQITRGTQGSHDDTEQWSGADLIESLADLQHPSLGKLDQQAKFEAINDFVRNVTDMAGARIEIPNDNSMIIFRHDDRDLPLESLGTGVHEVIIVAAAATVVTKSVICIEEPEIHLHPILQRKLIEYLHSHTNNQYIIATHSAALLDTTLAGIVGVKLDHAATKFTPASNPEQRWEICHDLGYRASDIVQSNFVVWVEGPSDRIYIRHWLHEVDPSLREGIDFSVMFYGGRLLSHLTPNDPEVEQFISLRRLNRNLAVVMDSDKGNRDAPLRATKERVVSELESGPGIAWVTSGREIENYVSTDVLNNGLDRIGSRLPSHVHRYTKVYPDGVDKVRLARAVADQPADLSKYDLEAQINALASAIQQANFRDTTTTAQ